MSCARELLEPAANVATAIGVVVAAWQSGVLPICPVNPGRWDMEVEGVAVELDEEQHFNRFPAETLKSAWYRDSAALTRAYRVRCERREAECLRKASNRRYWKNDSSIRQFGPAAPPAILSDAGSPRWKQRALYDFLKDVAPALVGTTVSRISIWDEVVVDGVQVYVSEILDGRRAEGTSGILALLEIRRSALPA